MKVLLLRYSIKHHLTHRLRLLMVTLALALGVAIFVSSYESILAAEDAIDASAKTLRGKTEWQVSRGRYLGIEESMVEKIRALPGAIAAPMIETTVSTGPPNRHNFILVGLDLESDAMARLYGGSEETDLAAAMALRFTANGVVISKAFAERTHLQLGDSFTLQFRDGLHPVTVAAVSSSKKLSTTMAGNIGFIELHTAERLLSTPGKVDRIDVAGASEKDLNRLCPSCQVEKAGKLSSAASDALGRIHSLMGVSVIALLVGVLLIYNSVQVSVLERLKDIAVIRSIGATRNQVFAFLLAEWAVIGLIGSSLGVAIGVFLAYGLVEYTKQTINSMLPLMSEAKVQVGWPLISIGISMGMSSTLLAAVFPISLAAKVKPLEILRPYTFRRSHRYLTSAIVGFALCLISNILILRVQLPMVPGLCVTGIVFLGVALIFPEVVLILAKFCRPRLRAMKSPEPYLALDGLIKTPHRTAFTIMTFGCALAMTVATETLVEGFRVSTGQWMSVAFPFDISVMGNDLASSVYGNQVIPSDLVEPVSRIKGVEHAYGVRKLFTPFRGNDAMVIGIETNRYLEARSAKKTEPWPPSFADSNIVRKFREGSGTFVSANFEQIYHVHEGDKLVVATPTGTQRFDVLGVVDDYSWQHGAFLVDRGVLARYWRDDDLSYIDASVKPGASMDDVRGEMLRIVGKKQPAFAFDRQEIKDITDAVLEQAVHMANMQAAIAVLIGTLGIVNAIWIGVINRKKEIALWRSIGITRGQVRKIILLEGIFVSIVVAFLGVAGGLYGGWLPLRSFSFGTTGYIYPIVVPWIHVCWVLALALVLGLISGLFPASHAAKLPILESIGYE